MLKRIRFAGFTAFEQLEIPLSPGIHVFLGENGTGKTHILKAAHAACGLSRSRGFAERVAEVFRPSGKKPGRLVRRTQGRKSGSLEVVRECEDGEISLQLSISNLMSCASSARVSGSEEEWMSRPMRSFFIPAGEMTSDDIDFPAPNGSGRKLASSLQKILGGRVIRKGKECFLCNKQGHLEFNLLAEGYRKLGLLWLLIQNGALSEGSLLCWDAPEAGLNPTRMQAVIKVLMELQRQGVQIVLATHDYVILQELYLETGETDRVMYHSLYRNEASGELEMASTNEYMDISPNAIDDAFGTLIHREIKRTLGNIGA